MATKKLLILVPLLSLAIGLSAAYSDSLKANAASKGTNWIVNSPDRNTPPRLREVWLRFHKDNLCEKVDAAFLFRHNTMGVVVNKENGKDNQKLFKMLEPLYDTHRIELYTVRLPSRRNLAEIRSAPPSFFANSLLSNYFGYARPIDSPIFDMGVQQFLPNPAPSFSFRHRMLLFARSTLEYNLKLERYAAHLPDLARAAFDPEAAPEDRKRARDICMDHARKLEKYTGKLKKNLTKALPEVSEEFKESNRPVSGTTGASARDLAEKIAADAQNLFLDVFSFLYPENHTVDLDELHNPSVLRSLTDLQRMAREFRDTIS